MLNNRTLFYTFVYTKVINYFKYTMAKKKLRKVVRKKIIGKKRVNRRMRKGVKVGRGVKRKRYAKHLYISLAFSILLLIISFFSVRIMKFTLMILSLITILTMYLWIFVRSIEKAIMIKKIPIEKLTEGDWIVKDVMVDNKRICGPKDLGIEKKTNSSINQAKTKR